MDFNDKDPIESLAAVLSVMLKIRNPELEDPEDLTTEMIEEGKSWALAVFQALLALDYRIYRVPQDLNSSERKNNNG